MVLFTELQSKKIKQKKKEKSLNAFTNKSLQNDDI